MKAQNNHYIPKFLTKPWETETGFLKYFDVESGTIEEEHSERLFATTGIYSKKLEEYLNKKIEKIMADQIPRFVNGASTSIDNRRVYEAMVLLFYLQAIRIAHSKKLTELEQISDMKDADLSALVDLIMTTDNLITLPSTYQLFFPSSGIYPILVGDLVTAKQPPPSPVIGYAMSIHPRCAIIRLPKKVPVDWIRSFQTAIVNYSFGIGPYANRVVVHPDVLKNNDVKQLAKFIPLRAKVVESIKMIKFADKLRAEFPWLV